MVEAPDILAFPALLAEAAAPSLPHEIVPLLLMGFVGVLLLTVGIFRMVIHRELGRRPLLAKSKSESLLSAAVFDAPSRWLAVRAQDPHVIETALGVHNSRACSWSDALATPFEPRLFISPPVNGWIVVMGCDLPDPADDIDECFKFLTGLSRKLGHVQFFSRNRAVAHHGWARLQDGKVLRAYIWAGETLWNQGPRTDIERELKLRCLTYTESSEVLGLAEHELLAANTERVVRIAAAWSIDPTSVEGAAFESKGIAGDLLHSKLH
jgi:hypothetical protein